MTKDANTAAMGKMIKQFIAFSREMGWCYDSHPTHLKTFQLFLEKKGIQRFEAVTTAHLLEYQRKLLDSKSAVTVNGYMSSLRGFWRFLIKKQWVTQNVPASLPRLKNEYFTPYLYTARELFLIDRAYTMAFQKADAIYPKLKELVRLTMFHLMSDCGLRVSETCHLKLADFNPTVLSLRIERTKFFKTRVIPLPKSTALLLKKFLVFRDDFRLKKCDSPTLFISEKGNPISRSKAEHDFTKCLSDLGLFKPKRRDGRMVFGSSNLHALRHSFAVRCLERWQTQRQDVDHLLPLLSSYMGHLKVTYTKTYLHLTPLLREKANANFEALHKKIK